MWLRWEELSHCHPIRDNAGSDQRFCLRRRSICGSYPPLLQMSDKLGHHPWKESCLRPPVWHKRCAVNRSPHRQCGRRQRSPHHYIGYRTLWLRRYRKKEEFQPSGNRNCSCNKENIWIMQRKGLYSKWYCHVFRCATKHSKKYFKWRKWKPRNSNN